MFRSCQIIIRELCSLLKLYYSIHNSIRICKRGVVAAYHVVWECVVEQWLGVRLVELRRELRARSSRRISTRPQPTTAYTPGRNTARRRTRSYSPDDGYNDARNMLR